ncbi:MAG TPA: toprim domain-containing protein [Flavipsychrobacter sp.]|nr:toprim domain-containing protein [Flavipsychrobacter sp.]
MKIRHHLKNKKLNVWFDHGTGKGGDLIDFGTGYFNCSVAEFLNKLAEAKIDFSFHQPITPTPSAGEKKDENNIRILETKPLQSAHLLRYLEQRNIPLSLAKTACAEVVFELYKKQNTAIGFQNNARGYELRSADFKGSSPKAVTFLDNSSKELAVIEGFFDYLSYHVLNLNNNRPLPNFLVLNSLSFFEKSRPLMEKHERINLYLNNDKAGISYSKMAIAWDVNRYHDYRQLYSEHKDLNKWLTNHQQKQSQRLSVRRFSVVRSKFVFLFHKNPLSPSAESKLAFFSRWSQRIFLERCKR